MYAITTTVVNRMTVTARHNAKYSSVSLFVLSDSGLLGIKADNELGRKIRMFGV
jgi:hypothetical protein